MVLMVALQVPGHYRFRRFHLLRLHRHLRLHCLEVKWEAVPLTTMHWIEVDSALELVPLEVDLL